MKRILLVALIPVAIVAFGLARNDDGNGERRIVWTAAMSPSAVTDAETERLVNAEVILRYGDLVLVSGQRVLGDLAIVEGGRGTYAVVRGADHLVMMGGPPPLDGEGRRTVEVLMMGVDDTVVSARVFRDGGITEEPVVEHPDSGRRFIAVLGTDVHGVQALDATGRVVERSGGM